jgi:hypothetical protein
MGCMDLMAIGEWLTGGFCRRNGPRSASIGRSGSDTEDLFEMPEQFQLGLGRM